MDVAPAVTPTRRPRFRRAVEPPPFRLTDDDVEIVRMVARHRLIRSTHIAELVGRSLDRTNDRLMRLFHAGYLDRPRAQLDRFPTSGSSHYIYALADRGVRLLREEDGVEFRNTEWSRKNREAGRPFIEHQIEIVNFQVALQRSVRDRTDVQLIDAVDMVAALPEGFRKTQYPLALNAKLSHRGALHDFAVIPDLVFGLRLSGGARHNFMVEIDRGTMPVRRADFEKTSFERKMLGYLAAHAAREHRRKLGWKNFRVLVVTTDRQRIQRMLDVLGQLNWPHAPGAALFLFASFDGLAANDPLDSGWLDGTGRRIQLI